MLDASSALIAAHGQQYIDQQAVTSVQQALQAMGGAQDHAFLKVVLFKTLAELLVDLKLSRALPPAPDAALSPGPGDVNDLGSSKNKALRCLCDISLSKIQKVWELCILTLRCVIVQSFFSYYFIDRRKNF